MPYYTFQHPETEETVDLFFHMNDEKKYVDDDGIVWNRVFVAPNTNIDGRINPFSEKQFLEKTANKRDKIGDWWKRSEELSRKRAEKNGGIDPVRQKAEQKYSKTRKGKKLPNVNNIEVTI